MTWPIDQALTYAHCLLSCPTDPSRSGTTQLAKAYIELHDEVVRLRQFQIDANDRLVLFAFAADRGASNDWPATAEAIGRVLEKYGPVIG